MAISSQAARRIDVDDDWLDLRAQWQIRGDTLYLNHGSFGLPPRAVRAARLEWLARCDEQPMDHFLRNYETPLWQCREAVAEMVGTKADNLVLMENATAAMNVVADSFPLRPGDRVLLNDHEYGAVIRIWQRRAAETGAQVDVCSLPSRIESADQVVDALLSQTTERTRLLVVSQITSPTAIILPLDQITKAFQARGVAICVDGPHALAQLDVAIDRWGWDFYTASCHKWLCAPLGTGFLYVHPRWQESIRWPVQSWGRLLPAQPQRWDEQFTWTGTRDASGYLALPAAIAFMGREVGWQVFRDRCRWLARQFEDRLIELTGQPTLAPRTGEWYGTMCHVPLGPGQWAGLQDELWRRHGIEVPIVQFNRGWFIRVSCHLYNAADQINLLLQALRNLGV